MRLLLGFLSYRSFRIIAFGLLVVRALIPLPIADAQEDIWPNLKADAPQLQASVLCDRLVKVGERCYLESANSGCPKNWAKDTGERMLLSDLALEPGTSAWDRALELFYFACQNGCSYEINEERILSRAEFCSRLGIPERDFPIPKKSSQKAK